MRRPLYVVLAPLVLLLGLLPLAGAEATPAGGRFKAVMTFDRNWRDQYDSELTWQVWRLRADGTRRLLETASWRAGSGLKAPGGRDECRRNTGWAPLGRYTMVQHDDYRGSVIRGRTFYLGQHPCRDGGKRVDLFIHTESGAGNVQCPDEPGDQACRWEPEEDDYRSFGCIKMSPEDLLDLTRRYRRYFPGGVRLPASTVRLRVVN